MLQFLIPWLPTCTWTTPGYSGSLTLHSHPFPGETANQSRWSCPLYSRVFKGLIPDQVHKLGGVTLACIFYFAKNDDFCAAEGWKCQPEKNQ